MLLDRKSEEACSFPNWYPQFSNFALESVVVPIDEQVFDYLLEDSTLVLPKEAYVNLKKDEFFEQEGECLDENDTENDEVEIEQPSFPSFSEALSQALTSLGGEVFIKLNWSSPMDASWITSNKSLKCTTLEDMYLLLKSSDILAKELAHIKEAQNMGTTNGCVVIKRWCDIFPEHEFRCFVTGHKLVGISQRDYKTYYGYIAHQKFIIREDIVKFFAENIRGKFPVENYTFDILRISRNKIKIIDFGPFVAKRTNTLLFTWEELQDLPNSNEDDVLTPEFRFLGENPGFQLNHYRHYGLPQDLEQLRQESDVQMMFQ
ncbi:hypothetical protein L9F63_002733, partial [Diploptera punctata]